MRPEPCPSHVLLQPMRLDEPLPWYETAERARELLDQFPDFTFSHLFWERYVWPGGYEIYYILHDCGVLCHNCANDELMRTIDPDFHDWYIVDSDVLWEGPSIYCDHCNREIQSAYGDPNAEDSET